MPVIRLCTQRSLNEKLQGAARTQANKENPENARVVMRPLALAGPSGNMWANGRTLKVRFLDGSAALQARCIAQARQWCNHANIWLEFGNSASAEIRISFQADDGSWSYVGTDNLLVDDPEPTMNFGWLTDASSDEEIRRVVIHEFGHALGFIHEHQSPAASVPWDKPAVYAYYADFDWSEADVDTNIFDKYAASTTRFTTFDPSSIMLYAIDESLTIGNYSVGWNTRLSRIDKLFTGTLYPTVQPTVTIFEHGSFGGSSLRLPPGRYDLADLAIGNDVLSSLRVPAGLRATLYRHAGFGGDAVAYTADASSIGGFNDLASSIVVEAGVVLYEHGNFGGRSHTLLPGRYANSNALNVLNDTVSSVRVPLGMAVTLYEHANFAGAAKLVTADTASVPDFNDRASSFVVEPAAVIFQHAAYTGSSKVLPPGRYDHAALGIGNDQLSSVLVPPGLTVTLYQHGGFTGTTLVLTDNTGYVGDAFNDQTSGVVVHAEAMIYQHINYGGAAAVLRPGQYATPEAFGLGNDSISSLRVPPGVTVRLYQHSNFQGSSIAVTADTPYVGSAFNDQTSSIVVTRV